jgi:hypothetical protein
MISNINEQDNWKSTFKKFQLTFKQTWQDVSISFIVYYMCKTFQATRLNMLHVHYKRIKA